MLQAASRRKVESPAVSKTYDTGPVPGGRSSADGPSTQVDDHGNATSGAKVTAGSGVNLLIKIINIVALLVLVPLL